MKNALLIFLSMAPMSAAEVLADVGSPDSEASARTSLSSQEISQPKAPLAKHAPAPFPDPQYSLRAIYRAEHPGAEHPGAEHPEYDERYPGGSACLTARHNES